MAPIDSTGPTLPEAPGATSASGTLRRRGLTRRSLLAGGAALALAPASMMPRPALGQGSRVPFGAAMQFEHFEDKAYSQAFLDHCDIILPMNELKLSSILRPSADTFNFDPADRLVDFALSNGRLSRGHTHVWHDALPDWLQAVTDEKEAERALVDHIEAVMDRYRGRLESWDVVNEVIAHAPGRDTPLRDSYWLRVMGPRHIPVAFQAAARADPTARLVLNDYDLEFTGDRYDLRRKIALSLVRQLQDANIRIDGVGIQAHLYAELKIDVEALARFGAELRSLGVDLYVTELDVIDWNIRGGAEEQDAAAMVVVRDLLDGLFASGRPKALVTWGITDRYSWISDVMPRRDGKPERPLPLDADYRPKEWFELIRRRLA